MGNFLWKYFLHKRYLTNMFLHIQVAPALCPLACPYEAFPKREEGGGGVVAKLATGLKSKIFFIKEI